MAGVHCGSVPAVFGSSVRQFLKNLRTALTYLSILLPGLVFAQAQMSTPGSFAVSPSGAGTYTIPIQISPGTAGMQPNLSLTYNSQGGNGLAGVGWSLSGLSAIHRCPATLVQDGFKGGVKFDANDRFCLDGQRLKVIAGANGGDRAEYRTEKESFSRIRSYGVCGSGPCAWTVETKSGITMEFGNTNDSRVEAASQPIGTPRAVVRLWAVNRVLDRVGNFYSVLYYEDSISGIHVPLSIGYTGNINTGSLTYAGV